MAVSFVQDSLAHAIAVSAGFPVDARRADIPSWGVFIVYRNARYLVKPENGVYKAVDVSVYAEDGTLLTDAMDVYLNDIKAGLIESAQVVGIGLGGLLVLIGGLYVLLLIKR